MQTRTVIVPVPMYDIHINEHIRDIYDEWSIKLEIPERIAVVDFFDVITRGDARLCNSIILTPLIYIDCTQFCSDMIRQIIKNLHAEYYLDFNAEL